MSRLSRPNDVPVAPFALRESGPLSVTEATLRCGGRRFRASAGREVDPRSTIDPSPCPACSQPVEWASTAKPDATGKIERYVYARCTQDPTNHRWAFRDGPAPAPRISAPIQLTQPLNPFPFTCSVCTWGAFTSDALALHLKDNHETHVAPATQPAVPEIAPMTTATTLPAPANPIEAWINALVGPRLEALELAARPISEIDEIKTMVKDMCDAALANVRKVLIEVPSMPQVSFTGKAHPKLNTILRYIAAGERFFLLVGPAATGKSTLAAQVAEALKVEHYAALAVTATLQREDLLGCRAHNLTAGTVAYRGTPIVEAWEKDGVICLDEVDRGDANTLCCLNSIEQGCLYLPRSAEEGGPVAKSSKAIVIATANTYGTGANRTYAGANQLDAAFLDRWRVIEVTYDRDLEIAVCGGDTAATACVTYLEGARVRADKANIRRPLTTRFARRAAVDMRLSEKPLTTRELMLAEAKGWSQTEISTVFA